MFTVMGITGQVGGAVARALLAQGHPVRAVVRNLEKAATWKDHGADLVQADFDDSAALTEAFRGTEGVFVMIPPNFAPSPDFREAKRTISAIRNAAEVATPPKVVCLSSVGAQQTSGLGIIESLHLLEAELSTLPIPSAFLRTAWFMENFLSDVQSVRYSGELDSYLQPADRSFPMIATEDIGAIAAATLGETWTGTRFLEIEGPRRYSPRDVADAFGAALGSPIVLKTLARDSWTGQFVAQGMPEDRTEGRSTMLDSINSGWIDFGVPGTEHVRGTTELGTVVGQLLSRS